MCFGRLKTTVKNLKNNPELLERYKTIIYEQEKENIIEKATNKINAEILNYIPHQPVYQKIKTNYESFTKHQQKH